MSARTRSILAWSLLVLGALILLVGSLTIWVKRQALDTDAWVATSTEFLEDDEIRAALSVYIVDQLYENGDVQGRLEQRLPPELDGIAAPLAGALRAPAERAADELLQRPRVQELWEDVNREAHEALLRILEDETREGVSTAEGTVTLDLRVFIVNVGEELGLGEQLDARLPEDAGQLTVLESDELSVAQDTVKVIKALTWIIIFAALAAFAGAIWLARKRREMLRAVGVVFMLVGILLLIIRNAAGSYLVDALTQGESAREAAGSAWIIGTSLLAAVGWALIVYGAVILLGALLAGPSGVARRVRQRDRADAPRPAGNLLGHAGRGLPAPRPVGAGTRTTHLAWRSPPRRPRRPGLRCVSPPGRGRARVHGRTSPRNGRPGRMTPSAPDPFTRVNGPPGCFLLGRGVAVSAA